MPRASVIVPAFNVSQTLAETLHALLAQTAADFEIIVVDDGSTDDTRDIAHLFAATHDKIKVFTQANRGLAGARNTGIHAAQGDIVGFCDADDLWQPDKLDTHIKHLDTNPEIGVSYSGSALISEDGHPLGLAQTPKLYRVHAANIFKRNPIGNGSAAVFRKQALSDIAYRPDFENQRDWVFDETFRQSEDIECWLRLALSTDWQFEGVPGLLTLYRVNANGLSSSLDRQLASWEQVVEKLRPFNPAFFTCHENAARAYQLRYLARRAISNQQPNQARALLRRAFATSLRPAAEEPLKTLWTLAACLLPARTSTFMLDVISQRKTS